MSEKLRLRLKVWTSPEGVRWIVALGMAKDFADIAPRDLRDHRLGEGLMSCYAMRDDEAMLLAVTVEEWNQMPFYYFVEDGQALNRPRAVVPQLMGTGKKVPR
jgi:hypothetical protein